MEGRLFFTFLIAQLMANVLAVNGAQAVQQFRHRRQFLVSLLGSLWGGLLYC